MNRRTFKLIGIPAVLVIFAIVIVGIVISGSGTAEVTHDFSKVATPSDFELQSGVYYTIKSPPKWTANLSDGVLILTAPADKNEIDPPLVNIKMTPLLDVPIRKGIRDLEKGLSKFIEEWSLQKSDPAVLPTTAEAWELIYTGRLNKLMQRKMMQVLGRNGTIGYVITFSADPAKFDKLYPTVEQMLASFHVSEVSPDPATRNSFSRPAATGATTQP